MALAVTAEERPLRNTHLMNQNAINPSRRAFVRHAAGPIPDDRVTPSNGSSAQKTLRLTRRAMPLGRGGPRHAGASCQRGPDHGTRWSPDRPLPVTCFRYSSRSDSPGTHSRKGRPKNNLGTVRVSWSENGTVPMLFGSIVARLDGAGKRREAGCEAIGTRGGEWRRP